MNTASPPLPLARLLAHAADAVQAVRQGRSLTDALARVPAEARPGTQALAFHALRWLGSASELRQQLAPKTPPPAVDALLVTALALLWPVPDGERPPYADHTLVDQAVTACRQRTPAAAGFVNAVLRRFVRERETLAAAARRTPLGAWNHPAWWIERIRHDWPREWQPLLAASNVHPPMTLRVNARHGGAAAYRERLAAQGRDGFCPEDPAFGGHALVLDAPCPVTQLPGWHDGDVSVQDLSAQRAAPLLVGGGALGRPLAPGARVLDACAAPGGKTAHLLELGDFEVHALDADAQRLVRVGETLQRLKLSATVKAGDGRQPATWWDGRPYDAILLDAPCSASGIVRRHPDVRWLRRPEDLTALARIQAELLDALWPLLAPGGRLLYATCSVFRAEGEAQIAAFSQRHGADAARLDPASPGHLLPLADNPPDAGTHARSGRALHDGFFYALLHKH